MTTTPPRQDADDFVRCFFEFVHPLFPVLHQPSFEAQYKSVWLPGGHSKLRDVVSVEEDCILLTTLNLVFALGCQYSSLVPRARRSSLADELYQQSRKHFVFEILDASSLPLVQLLLLKGIYLQSSRYPTRFWNVVGLAIRAAQSLGLHLDIESGTQLSREMRRRVWHVCVCLDRLLAMSFGRPTMVGKSWNVPVPSMIDDEYLLNNGEDGVQPEHVPSRMGLFVFSCPLFEILADVLGYFYIDDGANGYPKHLGSETCNKEVLTQVLDFNRRLDNLFDSIPEYLQTTKIIRTVNADKNSSVNLQQQVLYCRTVTFASITILLASLKCPYVDTDIGSDSFETSWDRCLSILEHYKDQIHSAAQAIHILQILRSRGTPELDRNDHSGGPEVSLADSVQSPQIPLALDSPDQFDLSTFNPYGAEFLADAWFGQQITSLDFFFTS
ncbi:hypothetical protein NECHADRAFT_75561 [Paecilomyces variotii No. 5]|uniref:Xylanolytic transcriptional activator regulatory domain-containing protein n=1 Tax=Byssochlamys spectabilis (strain No. 5 / NBRC 109023) TaxID=1356009 RepID=V5FWF8_BYSSN|nr:hypothetical protein NECHADRAFT_75561 [Paecilomyces variotii No. 5]